MERVPRRARCRTACRRVPVDRTLQTRPRFGSGWRHVIPVEWDEVVSLELGRLEPPPGNSAPGPITGIGADSRAVGAGDLFVALNTGVAYVDEAAARGAATLVPDDQEAALAALACLVRSKSDARVVAVVGSTGKTSTKDILGALCSAACPTIWADASLNNEIGLPLTVCRLEPETEVLVTEMGMRGLGQIAALCAVARPDLALVTLDRPGAPRARRDRRARRRARTPRRSPRCRRAASPSCRRTPPSWSRTSRATTSRSAASTAPRSKEPATCGGSRSAAR